MSELRGRVIAVTGAGAGIGLGILWAARLAGATAYGLDRTPEGLEAIRSAGGHPIRADVRDTAALEAAVEHVATDAGRLDGLVNNAGVTLTAPFLDAEVAMWDRLWETNQRSVLVGCRAAARIMVRDGRRGALVNIASVHAAASDRGYEGYAATKAAIVAMTRAMSWSLGHHGIRANSLSPGLTLTDEVARVAATPENAERFAGWHADGRTATVEEIAQLAVFLLSDASAALTGTDLIADHGTLARLCDLKA
ncbi:SDR family NAD(P)-dependent oxidoreductase [Jannaschia marina]|uniref:SDR family NAD(P)-dependent oxidoreductase n=1 Tax=Jannaschia marina TaxID=2741674 RepID=UPI0015CD3CD0|nr:SDR family oxidoreductase [Jannaschia marina]